MPKESMLKILGYEEYKLDRRSLMVKNLYSNYGF